MKDTIRLLTDIEKVRENPAMYIGDGDSIGLFTIIREIIDNAVDEYNNYPDKTLPITVNVENGVVSVRDHGRGISPYESNTHPGKIEEQLAFTQLGAGSKFKKDRLENGNSLNGGVHGVGATTANAMSDFFEVTVYKDGKIFNDRFEDGHSISKLEKDKKTGKLTLPVIGKTKETGTQICFKPSKKYLTTVKIDTEKIKKYLKDIAYLNPGLKLIYNDDIIYYSEGGIKEYLLLLKENESIFEIEGDIDIPEQVCKVHTIFSINNSNNICRAYTNGILNRLGGTHVQGLTQGLVKYLRGSFNENNHKKQKKKLDFIKEAFDIKKVESLFKTEHILRYCSIILDFRYSAASLAPQTKDSLVSKEIIPYLSSFIDIYSNKNLLDLTQLINLILDELYEKAKDINDTVKLNKSEFKKLTKKKLSVAKSKKPEELEIILVEGESAAGSLVTNRDSYFQAILPLKGKVKNVRKSTLKKAFDNEEVATIFATLFGDNMAIDRTSENLTHHKIIIGTDQDVDGKHIRVLLLTLFMTFAPDIVENGHVYLLDTPLFVNRFKDKYVYTYSQKEQDEFLKENTPQTIERNKGLGELDHSQVVETILDPKTRKLTQITVSNIDLINTTIDNLMGDDSTYRKSFIMKD